MLLVHLSCLLKILIKLLEELVLNSWASRKKNKTITRKAVAVVVVVEAVVLLVVTDPKPPLLVVDVKLVARAASS